MVAEKWSGQLHRHSQSCIKGEYAAALQQVAS